MLKRGWHPVPDDMPRDALLRIPTKWGPTFDDEDRIDCTWTEMWCICLWAKLRSLNRGTMKEYAVELQRYKKSARRRLAILLAAKIASQRGITHELALDASIEILDPKAQLELQQAGSPETSSTTGGAWPSGSATAGSLGPANVGTSPTGVAQPQPPVAASATRKGAHERKR